MQSTIVLIPWHFFHRSVAVAFDRLTAFFHLSFCIANVLPLEWSLCSIHPFAACHCWSFMLSFSWSKTEKKHFCFLACSLLFYGYKLRSFGSHNKGSKQKPQRSGHFKKRKPTTQATKNYLKTHIDLVDANVTQQKPINFAWNSI